MGSTNRIQAGRVRQALRLGIIAGAAGGLAEIIWIASYGMLTGRDTTVVAHSITDVIGALWMPLLNTPIAAGIVIHMVAAVGLGIVLAFAFGACQASRPTLANPYAFALGALTIVWGFNFLVVLPMLGPYFDGLHRSFVDVVPYGVSLASKLLFGFAVAATLQRHARKPAAYARA